MEEKDKKNIEPFETKEFRFALSKMIETDEVKKLIEFLKGNLKDNIEIISYGNVFKQYRIVVKIKKVL